MTSPPNHPHLRRIETVEQVLLALESPSSSFGELMACVSVARTCGDLRLARLAAEQAFGELASGDEPDADTVARAARIVVRSYIAQAESAQSLPRQLRRAKAWLNSQRSVLDLLVGPGCAIGEMALLSEVQALLRSSDPDGRAMLDVWLEELDGSDLEPKPVRPSRPMSGSPIA